MLETSLVVVGLVILTQIVKKYILPKFGPTGVHVFLFVIALAVVIVQGLMTAFPGFAQIVTTVGTYIAGAIAVYEILIRKLESPDPTK